MNYDYPDDQVLTISFIFNFILSAALIFLIVFGTTECSKRIDLERRGKESFACYPNKTCDDGYVCVEPMLTCHSPDTVKVIKR